MTDLEHLAMLADDLLADPPVPEAVAYAQKWLIDFANTMSPEALALAITAIAAIAVSLDRERKFVADSN